MVREGTTSPRLALGRRWEIIGCPEQSQKGRRTSCTSVGAQPAAEAACRAKPPAVGFEGSRSARAGGARGLKGSPSTLPDKSTAAQAGSTEGFAAPGARLGLIFFVEAGKWEMISWKAWLWSQDRARAQDETSARTVGWIIPHQACYRQIPVSAPSQ